MEKVRQIISSRLKANTLVELLLTMIISGIIFLLVFDGVDIIRRFSNTVNKQISAGQTMLYGHRFMEHLMENADSVLERGDRLLFYRGGAVADSVIIGDSFFILETRGITDTLFTDYISYHISTSLEYAGHIDSLFINYAGNGRDSIRLEYALPFNRYAYLNNSVDYENYR